MVTPREERYARIVEVHFLVVPYKNIYNFLRNSWYIHFHHPHEDETSQRLWRTSKCPCWSNKIHKTYKTLIKDHDNRTVEGNGENIQSFQAIPPRR